MHSRRTRSLLISTILLLSACGSTAPHETETHTEITQGAPESDGIEAPPPDHHLMPPDFPHPVVFWEICAQNWEEAMSFYSSLFGWTIIEQDHGEEDFAFVHSAGRDHGIPGGICRSAEHPSYFTVYVFTDDLQGTLDEVVRLGGSPVLAPTPLPAGGGTVAMFNDPDGRLTGLWSMDGMDPQEVEPVFSEHPVVHFEFASLAAGPTRTFYSTLFDWPMEVDAEIQYTEVSTAGGVGINGGIAQFEPDTDMAAYTSVYVAVSDLQGHYDRAIELGATGILEPTAVGEGIEIALFVDVSGNVVGLLLMDWDAWSAEHQRDDPLGDDEAARLL